MVIIMTTNTSSKPVAPTFTDEQLEVVQDAYRKIHSVFATLPGSSIPAFDKLCEDPGAWATLSNGAVARATNTYKARRAAKNAQFKSHLATAIEAHMVDARAAKSAYDAMLLTVPEAARPFLTPFRKSAQVSVEALLSDLSDTLPQGARVEQLVVILKGLDYTLVKGGEKKDKVFVEIPFVAKTENK